MAKSNWPIRRTLNALVIDGVNYRNSREAMIRNIIEPKKRLHNLKVYTVIHDLLANEYACFIPLLFKISGGE